jgi:hypothetical protein
MSCNSYSGNCSSYCSSPGSLESIAYSENNQPQVYSLESAVQKQDYVINLDNKPAEKISQFVYADKNYSFEGSDDYATNTKTTYFTPISFLKSDRPLTQFVDKAEDIRHYVEHTFELLTGEKFPEDIIINVVPEQEMKEKHVKFGGNWNPGVQGFCVNRKGFGNSVIFVKENHLDQMLLVVGYEIGHAMTMPLEKINEEAKAFAFEMAWVKTIYDNNIANLRDSLVVNPPAQNGLHNKAFGFVRNLIEKGRKSIEVFSDLISGVLSVNIN